MSRAMECYNYKKQKKKTTACCLLQVRLSTHLLNKMAYCIIKCFYVYKYVYVFLGNNLIIPYLHYIALWMFSF